MPTKIASAVAATSRESLADICGKPAKAELHPQVAASDLRAVASEARTRTVKLESAADEIGLHPSRLSHKFTDGTVTLAQLERLGPEYAAEFGRMLVERYGPLATPKARAHQKVREARAALDEIEQALEFIA